MWQSPCQKMEVLIISLLGMWFYETCSKSDRGVCGIGERGNGGFGERERGGFGERESFRKHRTDVETRLIASTRGARFLTRHRNAMQKVGSTGDLGNWRKGEWGIWRKGELGIWREGVLSKAPNRCRDAIDRVYTRCSILDSSPQCNAEGWIDRGFGELEKGGMGDLGKGRVGR